MANQEQCSTFIWRCFNCGATESWDKRQDTSCPACGMPLNIELLTPASTDCLETPPDSLWSYGDFLPICGARYRVSLGEGATPLVATPRLAQEFGFQALWMKNEMANPTGSFKDRQIAVGISHAREIGARTVAVVSSGNVACATAAYAARAGLQAVLFMHGQAGAGKIAQAAAYGAKVLCIQSPSPKDVFQLCLEACARFGWYHLSTAGMYEPYNVEGAKTIAYELYQQFNGDLPEYLVAPVGGGGLLGGIWRGLRDLKHLGLVRQIPQLVGVQASGCAPLKMALERNFSFAESLAHPWATPNTIAGGIADDILFDGHTVLPAIRETEGFALSVEDPEIVAGVQRLASTEGLLCELTTAVVIAALPALAKRIGNARVCAILTGNGIKDLAHLKQTMPAPQSIPPSLEAVQQALDATPASVTQP